MNIDAGIKETSLSVRTATLALLLSFFFFSSCVTQRYVEYIQDENDTSRAFSEAEFPDYHLKANDELFIQINSLDEAAASIYSNTTQVIPSIDPYSASLLSYPVDKDGYLLLPVIGNVHVEGKTISEVSLILRDSLTHVLNQPVVKVKLVNRYVSVLGEVNRPGHFPFSQDRLTLFDAIGLAGDITDYGDRKHIILVRNENGENIRINLSLTKSELLSSDYYYLRPNDMLYIKPLRNKFWGMRQFPWSVLFSAFTTGFLLYEIIPR